MTSYLGKVKTRIAQLIIYISKSYTEFYAQIIFNSYHENFLAWIYANIGKNSKATLK